MKNTFYLIVFGFLAFTSCSDKESDKIVLSKAKLSGYAQKGPFINGTSIVLSELDENFTLTGKTFEVQIMDNSGRFEVKNVSLASEIVQLKANGYYYNEITGEQSVAPITLYALANIESADSVCVNVLTHLEKPRIEYLIGTGLSFEEASEQAHSEVLSLFGFSSTSGHTADQMSIIGGDSEDAILLAASVILQAYRTEGELSEMLADIITDMREDGKLDNENIATNLINQAVLLEIEEIKQNLVARYAELETVVTAPDFETLLSSFIENSGFTPVGEISYPTSARYGQNILNDALDTITAWGFYSMAAELPAGNSLHIKISGATWAYEVMPDAPINWTSDDFSFETMSQNFYSVTKGLDCNLKIQFFHNDDKVEEGEDITIEYFENACETATHTRQVHINFAPPV